MVISEKNFYTYTYIYIYKIDKPKRKLIVQIILAQNNITKSPKKNCSGPFFLKFMCVSYQLKKLLGGTGIYLTQQEVHLTAKWDKQIGTS